MTVHNKFDIRDQRITLVRLAEGAGRAVANPLRASRAALARGRERLKVPVLLLSLPTIISVIYFLGLTVNRYESVSTFVVRSPSAAQVSEIANIVQGSGVVSSADDAHIVNEYMVSRDAMHDLIASNGLLEAFSHWGLDLVWAPPGTFWFKNDERLYRYYQNFVSVEYNGTTGISTL